MVGSAASHLLHTLSQIRPPSPNNGNISKPSTPVRRSIAGAWTTRLNIMCAAKAAASPDDDYHATLKALNSRGRRPRKSLGQVFFAFFFYYAIFSYLISLAFFLVRPF
uniref:Uncharacterized protein MANES_05G040300 n=1 Tax=Rhizophora mucronata TaxID=61149 RepID=A0A2P2KF03_RHIMU